MATVITRTQDVDDDGSYTTGTIRNNAWKQQIYDQIDALFTGAFSLVGPLTVTGFGTHKISAGGTGSNALWVENPTAGAGNYAFLGVLRDAITGLNFSAYSSTFTTAGLAVQGGATIDSNGVGGLAIAASSASGAIRFYSGGTTERMNLSTAGVLTVNGFGSHLFSAGSAGKNAIGVRNSTAGAANYAEIGVGNDSSALRSYWEMFSTTYTPTGPVLADGMLLECDGAGGMSIVAGHASGTLRLYSGGTTEWVRLSAAGGLGLKDGITAPATVTGFALLYVDTADGDLKVKFGDGTVKTIVVDT